MTAAPEPQRARLAIVIAVAAFAIVNLVFYFLSGNYFADQHQIINAASVQTYSPEQVAHTRIVFAVVSGVLAVVGVLAALRPRLLGHALSAVLGVGNLVGGVAAFSHHLPGVLTVTQLVAGTAMLVLAHFSYHRRSRSAWAFLVAICGVLAVVDFFGAPKIRGALDISLWTTMVIPGLYAIATVTLMQLRADYSEGEPVAA
jgi:hypothetical protein